MSWNWLKPQALFLISCKINGETYYLNCESSITNTLSLEKELKYCKITNFLFKVQVFSEYEQAVPRRFQQALLLKHKYSNKYLNFLQYMGNENTEGCKLALSHQKARWKILPCFKYQIKNSENIEYAERINITEQYYQPNGAKNLFLKQHHNQETGESSYQLLFGFHFRTEIMLVKFHQGDGKNFHYGQCVKIYHQESYAYLVDTIPVSKFFKNDEENEKRWPVAFENQKQKLGESSLDCIWALQQAISIKGATHINGTMTMNSQVRLKNAISGNYLTLQDHSTDDQNYKMIGDMDQSLYSIFKLQAVKEEDRVITQDVQVRMKHSIIYQYMAVSRYRESHAFIDIAMDKIPQDQHFFQFLAVTLNEELIIYFLFSLKKELKNINQTLSRQVSEHCLEIVKKLHVNIEIDLKAIEKLTTGHDLLKGQLNYFIPIIADNIRKLWQVSKSLQSSRIALQIISLNNNLLRNIMKNNIKNQITIFKFIHIFLPFLFKEVYVQQLLTQLLTNNIKLLSKLSAYNEHLKCNIIQALIQNIQIQLRKDLIYWKKMNKVIHLLQIMTKNYDKIIDINQRLIALQFFGEKKLFDKLFFSIKIKRSLFYIHHPTSNIQMPINNFKQSHIRDIIAKVLSFVSTLCQDRNIVSKKLIQNYLYSEIMDKKQNQDRRRPEDVKTIINCLYIRNEGCLRSIIFLLLANLYLHSFPRLQRYRPMNVMKLDIQIKEISNKDANSEMAELSSRLKESIMIKAEKSYYSRPLGLFKTRTDVSHESVQIQDQPSFTNNQIVQYKKIVFLLLETQIWTIQILKILRMLLKLSILNPQQKVTIYNKIFENINRYSNNSFIIKQLLMILEDLLKALKQDNLQKIKTYFILMFSKNKSAPDEKDIKYIIQSGQHITFNIKLQPQANQQIIKRYNQISSHVYQYHKSFDAVEKILNIFLKNQMQPYTMLNFMELIKIVSTPHNEAVSLLLNTSILGQNDLKQFQQLDAYSLQINNLTQISQEWLCNNEQQSLNYIRFIYLMDQITNFMYKDYTLDFEEGIKYRKKHKISKFRQVLMKNIGIHEYILNLLDANTYLLQGQTLRTLKKKIRITLQKCFGFLYQFCLKCQQNKDTLFLQMGIINKYINLLQVGQTQLWIHLIQHKKKVIQQVTYTDIQKIIFKIVKDRFSPSCQNCDYNPLYIDQLMALIDINGKPFKPNIQKIAKVLQQPIILRKFLYLIEQKKKRNQFCIQLYKLRIDPTQIPVIYQAKMIQLLIYMIKQLGNRNSFLRRSFKEIISLEYLFALASLQDSFTYQGIPTDMNFVLKIEVLKMMWIYLSANDVQNLVYQCLDLTKFLEYYKNALTKKRVRKQSMVDNQMLYYSYIEKYEDAIQYYLENSKFFYKTYLRQIFQRLHQIFAKLSNKQQNQNYQLLQILLDLEQLKALKVNPDSTSIEKNIQIYVKWSNFMTMSSIATKEQNFCKNLLYQILTNKETKKYVQQQKKGLFINLQRYEDEFILRIKSKLTNTLYNFQDFHQKPLYKVMFLFYEYIEYKINKPKDPFSIQPPSLIFSQTFKIVIIPILKLISSRNFDYNRVFCQKIYHYSLMIIKSILSLQMKLTFHKTILQYLQDQNQNGEEFLKCLKKAIVQMIEQQPIEVINQQINFAQQSLLLISEQQKIQPLVSSLLFIKELCRYPAFTSFFRGKSTQDKPLNFVEMIYKNLLTILTQGVQMLNIQKVKRMEYLCETLAFLFNGCNKENQQIVANKQFLRQTEKFLKIDLTKPVQLNNQAQDHIISDISLHYQQVIPEFKQTLKKQLNFFRFKHFYVTNCIKTSLLKLIFASTISNQVLTSKLKVNLSIQLIKLNIIALHEHALKHPSKSKENAYLQKFQNWRQVFNNQQDYTMSFTMSTYAFALMKSLQGELESFQKGKNKKQSEEPGQLYNFLPDSVKLLLRQLKDQPFFRDILLFYRKYFQAYKYFKDTIVSVEIGTNQEKELADIVFPKIPLCEKFGADMINDLQYESNRINQQQKSKSFLILTQKFYVQLQGDTQFDEKLSQTFPFSIFLIKIFKNTDIYYSIFCFVNLLISLLHLLANFQIYSTTSTFQSFKEQLFIYNDPKTLIRAILMVFQFINLSMSALLIMFLVIKKIPFYFFLHLKAYHQLPRKQRKGIYKNQLGYGLLNLMISVFLDVFLVIFSSLTVLHPVFSTFMLLYLVTKLQIGKILIKMVRALYLELLVVIGVLVVFNYCYAIFIYVNLTEGTSYGVECINMFVCMKLLMDQLIKGGFVTLLPNNYINNTITLQFFMEYSYNLLVPGVMIEIIRGLNIDRMSYLRQKVELIQKNQKEKCYICGQKQFQIDFLLQGYEKHLNQTHNRLNYVAFIFYVMRKKNDKYLFYEDLIRNCLEQTNYSWIPFETSVKRKKLMQGEENDLPFQQKLLSKMAEKELQARKMLAKARKTKRQISKFFEISEEQLINFSPQSPSSPTRSRFNECKQFRSH